MSKVKLRTMGFLSVVAGSLVDSKTGLGLSLSLYVTSIHPNLL